ncbi:MAG: hypothetical protein RIC55_05540 [Pirellulaceae bacterium]
MVLHTRTLLAALALMALAAPLLAADLAKGLKKGSVELKAAGPLSFGPEGILFIGDPEAAAIYAVSTGDTKGDPSSVKLNVDQIDAKAAAALGTKASEILINDMAVNPLSGNVYLSVSRGRGPDASIAVLKVDAKGEIAEVSLSDVPMSKSAIQNAPAPGGSGRDNQRAMSITDLEFADGRLIVAGLSNEEFASSLRSLDFPFQEKADSASVEIFHGAHGRVETRSPVRTFTTYEIAKQPHVLAAYTCTPLVKFPLDQLKSGAKVTGVTIAELGNRNRPLDMFVYSKGGEDFILMANSARGVMKISTKDAERDSGIAEKISGTAGQTYETIESLQGVEQLDRLNKTSALILARDDSGLNLRTIELP